MAYTLAQAAVATGRDRSTLLKAIKSGKLSAARDEATSAWQVDPAELARVYGIGNPEAKSEPRIGESQADMRLQLEVERMKTAGLESRLTDMEGVVHDLRRRLDTEAEERRRLTALLADRSTPPAAPIAPAPVPPAARQSWWRGGRRK
jgi:hypothetical protein